MNYISLDLELNNNPDGSTPNPKIIQVGISVGNLNDGIILTQNWLIDPFEDIYPFITSLTGITDSDIAENATPLEKVANDLSAIITQYNCFVNPITWGAGDATYLIKEFKDKDIRFPHFGRRELDVKQLYIFLMQAQNKSPKGGLASAMGKLNLSFIGKAHRADVDAKNTLLFYFELLKRQKKLENMVSIIKLI
jgi:inhibitor of KinA sporulation pathway (predicted exonuclease)